LGVWGSAALAAGLTVCALAFASSSVTPPPAKLSGVRVDYVSGPKLPASDVLALLRGYPYRDRLVQPSRADLIELTGFLGAQPMVKEVHAIRTIDEPVEGKAPRRMLELSLSLREPRLPVVLATGSRAWLDEDGRILPGVLPGPTQPRPIVRGIEAGGTAAVREALWLWSRLEGRIEPGLITDIRLDDPLDLKNQRGLVLCTRQGSRVIWGRPGDERFGVEAEDKVSDLVHTIRCQGDLGQIAVINVRFKDPFFVLRPSGAATPSVVQ
ncbi:MAG: hypothetical protein H0W72_12305, partial [Planctomycetes bacterium]|nr:hypothetical protein [Planctomycetota bacterium]